MLSPYGHTTVDTPNLNHLAAESMLMDNAISDSPDLIVALRSLWYPTHAAAGQRRQLDANLHLVSQLAEYGCESVLLTDDVTISQNELSASFDRIIEIETEPISRCADSAGETWLASFFAQTIEAMQNLEPGCLLWVHCRALYGPWDAPYEYRLRLADSEDPDPPEFVDPPNTFFNEKTDSPDIQLGFQQACAAQIKLLDELLGVFLEVLKNRNEQTLFSLFSTRGFPTGEHGLVGSTNNLHSETVHVPLFVRWPDLRCHSYRIQNLVQPAAIYHLLTHWFRDDTDSVFPFRTEIIPQKTSEVVCSVRKDQAAIQTHAWKMIRNRSNADHSNIQLYKKPDDRWEVNDVCDRCPQIVPALEALLDRCLDGLETQQLEPDSDGSIRLEIAEELAFEA